METQEILLTSITIEDRFRKDYGDMDSLVSSIQRYGLLQPITVDTDFRLLAGGRRYEACQLAELDTIPAVIRTVDDDSDRLEIELVENIHRKDLTWIERCRLEATLLKAKGTYKKAAEIAGVSPALIHRHVQLAEAVAEVPALADAATENEAWKALQNIKENIIITAIAKKAKEQEAEAFELIVEEQGEQGEEAVQQYRLKNAPVLLADQNYMIGDAMDGLTECNPGNFGFAEVDPPYGINLDRVKRGSEDLTNPIQEYTEVPADEYLTFVDAIAAEVYRVLEPNSFLVWWFGPSQYATVLSGLKGARFQVNEVPMIWDKGNVGQTQAPDTNLGNCYEMAFVCRKGSPILRIPGRSNIFRFTPVTGSKKIHATERPIKLMEEILCTFASPGQAVIVPFLGSGVTLRAAYKRQMRGCGWDLQQTIKNKFLLQVEEDFSGVDSSPKEVTNES